jgi:hypothetical protein
LKILTYGKASYTRPARIAIFQGGQLMAIENEKPSDVAVTGRRKSGRHTRALKRMLRGRTDIDALTKSTLIGLTSAWDRIEESGNNISSVPAISKELREIWAKLAPAENFEDLWTQ